jgi:starvation-inducible DNA-binding protein
MLARLRPSGELLHPKKQKGVTTMKPAIGLSDTNRNGVVKLLAPLLADEYVLYTKTRNFHWNVVGPQFNDLHKFFEAQYEELNDFVDDVAERMRQLGGRSPGTLAEFSKAARLKERPGQRPNARAMLAALLADHEAVIQTLRVDLSTAQDKLGDAGTCDFLTGLMEKHEKMAWMLRAFLEA